jgi:hypothetical protein
VRLAAPAGICAGGRRAIFVPTATLAALPASIDRCWYRRSHRPDHSFGLRRVQWFVKKDSGFGEPRIRCFESYPSGGPISQDSLRSGSLFERFGHACRDWLGSLSRDLLSERAKVFILRRSDVELLAHLSGRQLDKLQRGLHTH